MAAAMAAMACPTFAMGMCPFGDQCPFLHAAPGMEEPEAKRQKVESPQSEMPRFGLVKMKLCTFFAEGRCTKGSACTFAHGEHEMGQPYENQKPAVVVSPAPAQSASTSAQIQELQQLATMLSPDDPLFAELNDLMKQAAANEPQQPQQRVFMKTKICTFHEAGFCPRGDRCSFAHGAEEIGTPQPEGSFRPQGVAGGGNTGFGPPGAGIKKTICVHWQAGSCTRGAGCWFAHGEEEIGMPSPGPGSAPAGPPMPSSPMKTKMCSHFESGLCTRGDSCWFAHGEHEIGMPINPGSGAPPAFKKTKLCVNFENGFCTFGERCHFAHGEAEIGQPQPPGAPGKGGKGEVVMPIKGAGKMMDFMKGMMGKGDGKADGKGKGEPGAGCTAFVYFCPKDWDEEILKRHFLHCGAVASVQLLRDQATGISKGGGSVTFYSPRSVMKAIFSMNNFVAAPKCYLSVIAKKGEEHLVPPQPDIPGLEFPRPGSPTSGPTGGEVEQGCTIHIKYVPRDWTDVDVYFAFNHCGQISSVSDPGSTGSAVISFVEPLSAMRAIKGMNGFNAGNKCFLEVEPKKGEENLFADVMELLRDIPDHVHAAHGNPGRVPPGANLYVSGFPAGWTEEDMQREFAGFGQIICLRVQRHPDGTPAKFGFVGFKEPEMAQAAMSQLNGLQYDGGVLTVNIKEMGKGGYA